MVDALRCERCGKPFLIDLFGEGFSADEIAEKRRIHDRDEHGGVSLPPDDAATP